MLTQTYKDEYGFEGKIGDKRVKIFGNPDPQTRRATITSALANHGYEVKPGCLRWVNGAFEGQLVDGREFRLIKCSRHKLNGGCDYI